MKFNSRKTIGASLASAACSLLGALPGSSAHAEEAKDWNVDAALLYYGEDQGRVKDVSARVAVATDLDEDRKLNVSATVDALTGASPSGAVPTDSVQTFTRPSGNGSYQIAPGNVPLDDTFKDTRFAATGAYTMATGTASRLQIGADGSGEHDYFHVGANLRWEHDFNQKNTTLFVGGAFGSDSIKPVGGVPIAFAAMTRVGDEASSRGASSDNKTVIDGLLGVSQILSRRAVLDLSLGYSLANGYLTDPYKILSVVDPVTGRPVASPTDSSMRYYRFEKRPDSRAKGSLFAEYRYALDRDSFAVNYRYMTDDWGVKSHTVEARYRWNFSPRASFEPQLRFYQQTAADFYHTLLIDGAALPDYASADYRLAKLDSWTVGARVGWQSSGMEYSVRLAYYSQTPKEAAGSRIGVLANYSELVPSMKAVIAQFGVKFGL